MKLTNFPTVVGRRLRIAVIGCGRISKNHFSSILKYPDDLVLTSVCDNDSQALKSATAEYGVTGYADLSEMLSCENLDLLVLCTPRGSILAGYSCRKVRRSRHFRKAYGY